MRIRLHDADRTKFPNLALMKLSSWHKKQGDSVKWWLEIEDENDFDIIYSSKVFSYTKTNPDLPSTSELGGFGYNDSELPDEIEYIMPDYHLYNLDYSMGFLTRGCSYKCSWCIVPEKEGKLRAHQDIEDFAIHRNVVLLDNNVLGSKHGIRQIEKIVSMDLKIDFNQGLKAKLIDDSIAKLLSKVKWLHAIRLSCDTLDNVDDICKAVLLLRWYNTTPRNYFCYVLMRDFEETFTIVKFLKGLYIDPFVQPYRDKNGSKPPRKHREFARWVNHKPIFKSVSWQDYWEIKKVLKNT